jgi:hypothetical protein
LIYQNLWIDILEVKGGFSPSPPEEYVGGEGFFSSLVEMRMVGAPLRAASG